MGTPTSGSIPIGLNATPGNTEILLAWTPVANATFYSIYRAAQPGVPYSLLASRVAISGYEDTSVSNGIPYYYVITSVNPGGTSGYSAEVSAIAEPTQSAPGSLQIQALTSASGCAGDPGILLTWNPDSYFTSYQINRGSTSGSEAPYMSTHTNFYWDCNPGNGIFYYTVTSVWDNSQSTPPSNEVSAYLNSGATFTITPGIQLLTLNWNQDSNATAYSVYKATNPFGPFNILGCSISSLSGVDTLRDLAH